jgi:Short C-terminal domain
MDDKLAQLKQLGELRAQGVLSDAEFEQQKSRILNT